VLHSINFIAEGESYGTELIERREQFPSTAFLMPSSAALKFLEDKRASPVTGRGQGQWPPQADVSC